VNSISNDTKSAQTSKTVVNEKRAMSVEERWVEFVSFQIEFTILFLRKS
jgi:hypothetical protein